MPQAITSTKMVRMAVARLELMPWTPILPRIAVRLANNAESPGVNGPHEKAPISLCGRARPHRAPLRLLYSSTGKNTSGRGRFGPFRACFFAAGQESARAGGAGALPQIRPPGAGAQRRAFTRRRAAGPGPIPHMRGRRFPAWGRCSRPGSFARAALWPGPEARGPLPRAPASAMAAAAASMPLKPSGLQLCAAICQVWPPVPSAPAA